MNVGNMIINPVMIIWMLGVQIYIFADRNEHARRIFGAIIMTVAWMVHLVLCIAKLAGKV